MDRIIGRSSLPSNDGASVNIEQGVDLFDIQQFNNGHRRFALSLERVMLLCPCQDASWHNKPYDPMVGQVDVRCLGVEDS